MSDSGQEAPHSEVPAAPGAPPASRTHTPDRRYYRFVRANTNAERMMREVIGTLEELGLLGHTVSIGAIHGPPRIDAAGTCALVVSVRAYPDWLLAAAPLLDRRGLVARVRDDDTEVHMPPGVAEAGVNISSLD